MKRSTPTRILILEDEMIIAADLSMQLTKLGYKVIGIQTKAEGLLETITANPPDIILMDIVLAGAIDGIEAAILILKNKPTPVVFLTSNTDDATFKRALEAKPFAFISKPFHFSEIQRTLKLIEHRMETKEEFDDLEEKTPASQQGKDVDHVSSMNDRLFIRHKNQLVKVYLSDIYFVAADRTYCKVHTTEQVYLLAVPLRAIALQLPEEQFLRIHRSFVVNLTKIDTVNENLEFLTIDSNEIPVSRRMKEEVGKRLNVI